MQDDFELLDRWGEGDAEAANILFERYFAALYRFFNNKAPAAVDDLVQETVRTALAGVPQGFRPAAEVGEGRLQLRDLGDVQVARGNLEAAHELYQRAEVVLTKTLGKQHPDLARMLDTDANVLDALDRPEEARPLHERAQAMADALGIVLRRQGAAAH